jgi:hypothetical protein
MPDLDIERKSTLEGKVALLEKLQQRHSTAGLEPCITYFPHMYKQNSINDNEVKEFVAGFAHCVHY